MLKAALCGSYVNFGVFRLYGDEALDNALNVFVKLLLSIPQSDLLVMMFAKPMCPIKRPDLPGLPEAVTDLLRAARVSRAGSHEFPLHAGAARVLVHSLLHIGGSYCLRCATE